MSTAAMHIPGRISRATVRRTSGVFRKRRLFAYAMVAPFLVAFLALLVVPIGYALYLSLFQETLVGGRVFAGIGNYVRALTDPNFYEGLGRVALFLVIQVPVMLVLALLFALALDSGSFRGHRFVRLAIFVPYAIPGVVGVLMWGYLYGPNFGLITQVIGGVGLTAPNLLSEQNMLGSIMNLVTWQFAGYNMVILFAALRAIPGELFEAAEIDGAGPWRIAWSIKIPAIRPAIYICLIFSGIGAFQLFDAPNLLSSLAPAVITQSYTPTFYAFNTAFGNQNLSYAATIAFVLGVTIAIVSYVVQLSIQKTGRR